MFAIERIIPEILIKHAENNMPGPLCFIEGKQQIQLSYTDFAAEVMRLANALQILGLKKGDRLCLILPENRDFAQLLFAAMHLGVIAVPMAPPIGLGQLQQYAERAGHIFEACGAKYVAADKRLKKILDSLPNAAQRKVFSPEDLTGETDQLPLVSLSDSDIAFLQFTSGSTSKPKGVMVSHGNIRSNVGCMLSRFAVTPNDVSCSWLPFFHDMGLVGFLLNPVAAGITSAYISPLSFLKRPVEWLKMISEWKGSISFAPNFAYGLCIKRIKERDLIGVDLSSWRVAGCGAEPINYRTLMSFKEKFSAYGLPRHALFPAYGMAESTLAVAFPPLEREVKVDRISLQALASEGVAVESSECSDDTIEVVCCGYPFEGHQLKTINSEGERCAEREIGEILIAGPSITSGYFKNQQATEAAIKDGWLRTGDLGYLADQELYICGRAKEVIIVAGHNYYPTDLEWSAAEVAGVRKGNVIAFGIEDLQTKQQKIVLAAETREDKSSYAELAENIKARILSDIGVRIDRVLILPAGVLPKTSSGKLRRGQAKESFLNGELVGQPRGIFSRVRNAMTYLKILLSRS